MRTSPLPLATLETSGKHTAKKPKGDFGLTLVQASNTVEPTDAGTWIGSSHGDCHRDQERNRQEDLRGYWADPAQDERHRPADSGRDHPHPGLGGADRAEELRRLRGQAAGAAEGAESSDRRQGLRPVEKRGDVQAGKGDGRTGTKDESGKSSLIGTRLGCRCREQ